MNEQFLEALRTFGTLILQGAGSEEEATKGLEFINGIIAYAKNDSVVVVGTSPAPDSTIQNIYYWNYSSLAPFQHKQIHLTVDKPNTVGFPLQSVAYADVRDTMNSIVLAAHDTANEIISCSYDPNEKHISPVTELWGQNYTLIGEQLSYTITFQNTGNAAAQNVVVVDTLPSTLDLTTFNLTMTSHPVIVHINQDGIITFIFNGIYLPDSASNEPASHGFIQFTIEALVNIPNNTLVQNTAFVFFDQNAPVQTSTASTTFVINYPVGISEYNLNTNGIAVYPNPANGIVTISTMKTPEINDHMSVFDNSGKLILHKPLAKNEMLNLSGHSKGLYTIKIIQGKSVSFFKLAVN